MKLEGKKDLAARTLGVGKHRIIFNLERLSDIKEAITKQDIRDLVNDKAITLKEIGGRKKIVRRKHRRRAGSIKIKKKDGKREYVILTRKLRNYLADLRKKNKVTSEQYYKIRKEIRAKDFKSKANLKERIENWEKGK